MVKSAELQKLFAVVRAGAAAPIEAREQIFDGGIGAMTDERVKDFFDKMVKVGIVKPDTDYKKAYTTQFVNKGVGLELRPK